MTHFFFHSWRGDQRSGDDVGLDLAHRTQAQDLAARDLGEMARDVLHGSAMAMTLGIDIADADGLLLARLRLAYTFEIEP